MAKVKKDTTVNFLYWLYNHRNIEGAILECFGGHLGKHFLSKLKDGEAASVLKFVMDMSDDHKETLIAWVDKNYNYKGGN
jgi:prenyltransferase beta subunit